MTGPVVPDDEPNLLELVNMIRGSLTQDLLKPRWRGRSNPMAGHCYVASEALFHALGGRGCGWYPAGQKHEGDQHWYLVDDQSRVVDPTADQFATPVPYASGKRRGFLTRKPSKSMPSGKLVLLGVWEEGKFIGSVMFGSGATPNLAKPYGVSKYECAELVRIALDKHATPVTRIVSIAIRLFRKRCPGIRVLVSYADPAEGHHGGIYQAGGWTFTGRATDHVWLRDPSTGEWLHPRTAVTKYGTASRSRYPAVRRMPGKIRYVKALDRSLADLVESMRMDAPRGRSSPAA